MSVTAGVIAVQSTFMGRPFLHVGLPLSGDGVTATVLSKGREGWKEEPFEEFVGGERFEFFLLATRLEERQILERIGAEQLNYGYRYSALANNCEHGLLDVLGFGKVSPQAERGARNAIVGGAVGILLSALSGGKHHVRSATVGACVGAYVPVSSLAALYAEYGLPVVSMQPSARDLGRTLQDSSSTIGCDSGHVRIQRLLRGVRRNPD